MRRSLVWLVVKWCLIALDEMNTSCFGWLELRRQNLIVARFICLHLILVIDGKCKLNSSQAWAWCWACGPSISVHTINRSLVPMWHAFILHSYSYNHNCLWTTKQQFSPSWYRSIKKCFFFCFFFFFWRFNLHLIDDFLTFAVHAFLFHVWCPWFCAHSSTLQVFWD